VDQRVAERLCDEVPPHAPRKGGGVGQRRRTRRPGGQGAHSEPFGAPVSRALVSITRPSAA